MLAVGKWRLRRARRGWGERGACSSASEAVRRSISAVAVSSESWIASRSLANAASFSLCSSLASPAVATFACTISGEGAHGLELRVQDFGFKVVGLGFRVEDLGFSYQGVRIRSGCCEAIRW